ncbi:MAG: DNA polymerase Y family protein [Planctomycetota bacterium]
MPRALSLYLPAWSVDLARRRRRLGRSSSDDGRHNHWPIILVETVRGQELVTHACPRARACGIMPGLTRSHAHALAPDASLHVMAHEPQRDLDALRILARWLHRRYSPTVAVDPPDGLLLDITGCGHLFGGEHQLRRHLLDALERRHITAQIGIASTFMCARAVSRFDCPLGHTIETGDEHQALAPLPIDALDLDDDTLTALNDVGIDRIEHLVALPRSELARRYGGDVLRRLDEATGEAMESINAVPHRSRATVERLFNGGLLQTEALQYAVRDALTELLDDLQRRERGLRRLELRLERLDLPPATIAFDVSTPTRDQRHIWSLLEPKLSDVHFGHGIEQLMLTASRTGRLPHAQHEHWRHDDTGSQRAIEQAQGELLDTMIARLTSARVLRLSMQDAHQPEACARMVPANEPTPRTWPAPVTVDRPSRLPQRPQAVTMIDEDARGMPQRWRREGATFTATRTVGPERIAPAWWDHDGSDAPSDFSRGFGMRDYFRVQDEHGRWHWLCRMREHGRWWHHGDWS